MSRNRSVSLARTRPGLAFEFIPMPVNQSLNDCARRTVALTVAYIQQRDGRSTACLTEAGTAIERTRPCLPRRSTVVRRRWRHRGWIRPVAELPTAASQETLFLRWPSASRRLRRPVGPPPAAA